jgi:SAM-dependent methyltransferase
MINEVGSIAAEAIKAAAAPIVRAACPACGGYGHDLYKLHHGMTLLACRACATVHLHPRPTAAETSALYSDAYGNASESYFAKVEKKLRRSRRRMAMLARLQPPRLHVPTRFLDIGCNGGFIVEAAREQGFEAYGLDIDPVSIDYARRRYPANRFMLSTLEDYAPHAPRFDLIYCSEVIEHLADPRGFIDGLFDLLTPGGLFFLTTPDISHWRRARDVTRWDGLCPPSHCVYFNPRSLTALLRRAGFIGVERRWSFKPGIKLTCRKPASI